MRLTLASSLCGIVLISTGCGTRARFEYDHQSSTTCESLEGNEARESTFQASRTVLGIATEERPPRQQQKQSDEQVAVGRANEPAKSAAIQIEFGTINLHLGDVNITHDNSQRMQKVEVTQQFSALPGVMAASNCTPVERTPQRNSRCDQLRRQHEQTLAEWEVLFR